MAKIIGILSLKGGVGKTSTVVSLGSCLADFGKRVLLVDCNFSAPNLGIHLDVIDPEKTVHHVLDNSVHIGDAIVNLEDFDLLPASVFKKPAVNPLKLKDKLRSLKRNYDVILLDSSPALNNETLSVILASDELIVVTTPDKPTLSNTLKAVRLAKKRGTPIKGLILNKVHNKGFELSLDEIERTVDVPVMAVIPHDIDVLRSLSNTTPFAKNNPKSKGGVEYKKLAAVLIGEKYKPFIFKEWILRLTPKKQEINREIFYKSLFE